MFRRIRFILSILSSAKKKKKKQKQPSNFFYISPSSNISLFRRTNREENYYFYSFSFSLTIKTNLENFLRHLLRPKIDRIFKAIKLRFLSRFQGYRSFRWKRVTVSPPPQKSIFRLFRKIVKRKLVLGSKVVLFFGRVVGNFFLNTYLRTNDVENFLKHVCTYMFFDIVVLLSFFSFDKIEYFQPLKLGTVPIQYSYIFGLSKKKFWLRLKLAIFNGKFFVYILVFINYRTLVLIT